jgi:hypothetical protein
MVNVGSYSFSMAKAETTKPHETTQKNAKFMLLLRVASCGFVVSSFFIENDIDPV